MISVGGSFPAAAMAMVTAGFTMPPEIGADTTNTRAKAAPIARGLDVARMIYTKNRVPKNSTK